MNRNTYSYILNLLRQEVKPALGCTEPVAVALAVARASAEFEGVPERVEVSVSPNILKNAMGVGIPGTGLVGLPVAAALAITCGKWEYGLEVLKDLSEETVAQAKNYVSEGRVSIGLKHTHKLLLIEATCHFAGGHSSTAVIQDTHDRIVSVVKDGEEIASLHRAGCKAHHELSGSKLTMDLIYEFACIADLADLDLIREEIVMNKALSAEGIRGSYGLKVGRTIKRRSEKEVFGDSLMTRCMYMTAAASDARMAGCTLPAMSNSGSGNQGITVSMPVIAVAEYLGSTEEQLIRALVLANLIAIHIKSYLGRLSALCGCVVASTGSSCGIVMLKGGSLQQMCHAIKNMIGNISGMVCDGAKEGCAMKVASGVSCSVQSAILALEDICVSPTDGIIDEDVEKTIQNLGKIGSRGMKHTDEMILDIMVCK